MKKIVELLLVLALALSLLAVPALADESASDEVAVAEETVTVDEDVAMDETTVGDKDETKEETAVIEKTPVAAGPVTVSVTADKSSAKPGDEVTFTIAISGAANAAIGGFGFDVNIPGALEYASHKVACESKFKDANYNADANLFSAYGGNINDASWTVMTLTCKVKATVEVNKDYTLSLSVKELFDSSLDMNDITYTAGSATVNVPCPHTNTEVQGAKKATCKEDGYTGDTVCKTCGTKVKTGTTTPKGEHSWNEGEVTTEATCTTDGEKTVTCTVCGETKTEKIPAGHKWNEGEVTTEATCTESGEKTFTCSVCGETKIEKIPAAHKWDEGKVTKEATATEKGEKLYTCTVCGETKTEEIPALGSSDGNGTHKTSPKTGDGSNIIIWALMLVVCSGAIALVAPKKKTSK